MDLRQFTKQAKSKSGIFTSIKRKSCVKGTNVISMCKIPSHAGH